MISYLLCISRGCNQDFWALPSLATREELDFMACRLFKRLASIVLLLLVLVLVHASLKLLTMDILIFPAKFIYPNPFGMFID